LATVLHAFDKKNDTISLTTSSLSASGFQLLWIGTHMLNPFFTILVRPLQQVSDISLIVHAFCFSLI